MKAAERIFDWLVNALAVVASLLLIAIMLATVFKVFLRGVAGHGIIGIDQLSGTAMVYLTFLGGVWVLRSNGHVAIDLLISGGRPSLSRRLVLVNSLIGAAVCFVVAYFGAIAIQHSLARGIMVATELEIPRAIGLIPIPVGALLMGIEFLRRGRSAYHGDFEPSDELRIEA